MPAFFRTTIGRRERRRRKRRQWELEMADQNDAEQWVALQAANLIVLGMTVLVLAIHLISFFLSPKEKAKIEIQI